MHPPPRSPLPRESEENCGINPTINAVTTASPVTGRGPATLAEYTCQKQSTQGKNDAPFLDSREVEEEYLFPVEIKG